MMITFEEFEEIALNAWESFPDDVKRDINLGIAVIYEPKTGSEGMTFIMGEYYVSPMLGKGVRIYYGSFMNVMGDAPHAVFEHEITKTVRHELRHHVEISAGVDFLGDEDREKMSKLKKRFGKAPTESDIIREIRSRFIGVTAVILITLLIIYLLILRHIP